MEDFDLKGFLTENKLTTDSRILKEEFEGEIPNSQELTSEDKKYLEGEIGSFLNKSLYNSDILVSDSDSEVSPSKEEIAIQFIIDTLTEWISYYN
jgi:hypothetical protein